MFIHLGRKAGVFWVVRTRHPQFRDWLVACDQHFEMVEENHFEMVGENHFEMVKGNHPFPYQGLALCWGLDCAPHSIELQASQTSCKT